MKYNITLLGRNGTNLPELSNFYLHNWLQYLERQTFVAVINLKDKTHLQY